MPPNYVFEQKYVNPVNKTLRRKAAPYHNPLAVKRMSEKSDSRPSLKLVQEEEAANEKRTSYEVFMDFVEYTKDGKVSMSLASFSNF